MSEGNNASKINHPALLAAEFTRLHQTCLSLQLIVGQMMQQRSQFLLASHPDDLFGLNEVMAIQSLDEMTQVIAEFEKLFQHMSMTAGPSTGHMLQVAIVNGIELHSLRQRLLKGDDAAADDEDDIFFEHRGTW
ncbi:hypothetical protein [Paracoccus sulfuroxidans]|nr:hypothetical protein [Paracoccus sulfuroxidans]